MASSALDVAAKSASFNIILQVLLRISSFILNGFVLHFVSAELLGVVNLRLTLLYSTILFLSREPLRKAALTKTTETRQWTYTFNLLWLALPMGVVCALVLSLIWISPLLQQPELPGDWVGVVCFALSSMLELSAEPLWILGQLTHHISIKVVAEGLSQIVRCILVAVGVVYFPNNGVIVFAVGQLMYSVCYTVTYYSYFIYQISRNTLPIKNITDIFPSRFDGKWQSQELINLAKSFFKQSILKQLLTDGERYIMTLLGVLNFTEQGVYDIVNNLGSLVARFIFLPIEESFYVFFSSTLLRGEQCNKQSQDVVKTSSNVLSLLLKMVSIFALIILVFGINYSNLALDLYGGKVLSVGSGPILLKCYCLYVVFLAVNGITECFMFAAMSQQQVDKYNQIMLLFSVMFLFVAVILIQVFGSVGFILANCINMATRILHSTRFIKTFFNTSSLYPLTSAFPALVVIVTLVIAFVFTFISQATFCCHLGIIYRIIHVLIGCGCLLIVGVVIIIVEQDLCIFLMSRLPTKLQNPIRRIFGQLPGLKYIKTD